MAQVTRIDRGTFKKARIDKRGYLIADAYFTRAGVFLYRRADGSIIRELRHPDEVFKKTSMDSLANLVITNDHPAEGLLTSSNTKKYFAGYTGDAVTRENLSVNGKTIASLKGKMIVSDEAAVKDVVDKGKVENSCGYTCDLDFTPGVWEGEPYDAQQKNIEYNHVAIVDRGRAGPEIRIKLDSQDAIMIDAEDAPSAAKSGDQQTPSEKKSGSESENPVVSGHQDGNKKNEGDLPMVKIRIDGKDFEVSEAAASLLPEMFDAQKKLAADTKQELDAIKKDLDALKKDGEALKGKADALDGEVKKRDEQIAALKKDALSEKDMEARVRERIAVRSFGKTILGKEAKVDEMDIADIKKQSVIKAYPNMNVTGKTDAYFDAAFDVLRQERKHDASEAVKKELGETIVNNDGADDLDKVRADAMQKASEAWKKPIGNKLAV